MSYPKVELIPPLCKPGSQNVVVAMLQVMHRYKLHHRIQECVCKIGHISNITANPPTFPSVLIWNNNALSLFLVHLLPGMFLDL